MANSRQVSMVICLNMDNKITTQRMGHLVSTEGLNSNLAVSPDKARTTLHMHLSLAREALTDRLLANRWVK